MATDDFVPRQGSMPRNFLQIESKLAFVANWNFNRRRRARRPGVRLAFQGAFDCRSEFVKRSSLRRIVKNPDRRVGRHQVGYSGNLRELELPRRAQNGVEGFLRFKLIDDAEEQR